MASQKSTSVSAHVADPEVQPKADRRQFSAAEKLRILAEADRCSEPGQVGALLRREGIYSSHLSKWRWLRKQGQLQALQPQPRGPNVIHTPEQEDIARLQRECAAARQACARGSQYRYPKKVSALLGLPPTEQ